MNVLNLFAGMEVGRLACERAGVPIDKYYSSEIDKYAIQVSKVNWPDIIHLGDVTKVYGCTLPDIHLLLGGSPCQGFSFAGKQLNFNDPRSALLFEYVRILKELREYNPNIYFLLENVMMKKEYQDVISDLLGVKPVMINSALVSAQNRKRLYWTNIPFLGQPEDKGIVLKDILETNFSDNQDRKSLCLSAGYRNNPSLRGYNKSQKQLIRIGNTNPSGRGMNGEVYSTEGKSPTLTTNKGEGSKIGCYQVGSIYASNGAAGRVYSENGKSPSLVTGSTGGNKMPKVEISEDLYLSEKEIQRGIYQAQGKVWKSGNKMGNMNFPNNPDKKAKTLCTVNTKGGRETNHIAEFAGRIVGRKINPETNKRDDYNPDLIAEQRLEINSDPDKTNCLTTVDKDNVIASSNFTYRKLTVTECERLQTVPDGYTQGYYIKTLKSGKQRITRLASNTQAYKMLGNGWTEAVIRHLLLPLGDYSCLF